MQDADLQHHLQPGLGRRERCDAGRRRAEDSPSGADRDLPGHDGAIRLLQLLCSAQEVRDAQRPTRLYNYFTFTALI